MKLPKDIEKFVRDGKPNVKTGSELDKLIIDSSYSTMDQTLHDKSPNSKSSIFMLLMRNKIAFSTVAAVILLAIGLFVFHIKPDDESIHKVPNVTESPAEMLSTMSLIATYRQGGIEAMENQMDKAVEKLEPLSGKVTIEELLEGFNGS